MWTACTRMLWSAMALAALALPATGATRWISPRGDDAATGTSRATAWRTIARANAAARPGDVIRLADGEYADFPEPAVEGRSGARITYMGNLRDPRAVRVRAGGTLRRGHITLRGLTIAGEFVLSGTRDSLADARVLGRHPKLIAANDCVLARVVVEAERFWIFASYEDTLAQAKRDTIVDCVFRLRATGHDGPVVRMSCVSDGVFERNRWELASAPGAVGASAFKLFWVRRCRFVDSRWIVVNDCTGACDEAGWFMQRDFTQSNYWLRDTLELGGAGQVQFFGSGSGTYPGSVMNNTYERMVVRAYGNLSHGAAMIYQDAARWDTLRYCTLVGSASGLLMSGDNAGPNLIEHCTIVGFQPVMGAFGCDAGVLTRWSGTTTLRNNVFYVPPSAPRRKESTGAAIPYEAARGHLASNHNVYFTPLGRDGSLYVTRSGLSAPGRDKSFCRDLRADSASVWGSPRFADSSSVRTFDPRLLPGSRAIGAVPGGRDAGAAPRARPRPAGRPVR